MSTEPENLKRVKVCTDCGCLFDPGNHPEDDKCPDCQVKHVQPDAIDVSKELEDEYDPDPDYEIEEYDDDPDYDLVSEDDLDPFDLDIDWDDDDRDD